MHQGEWQVNNQRSIPCNEVM